MYDDADDDSGEQHAIIWIITFQPVDGKTFSSLYENVNSI